MSIINRTKIDSKVLTDVVEGEIMTFLRENYYEIRDNVEFEWNGSECIVNIRGKLYIQNMKMTKMTNGQFRFGKAQSVDISHSNITSLEGCPREVSGGFICAYTQIRNLKGLHVIKGNLVCTGCKKLVSLEDTPLYIGGCLFMEDCPNITKVGDWSDTFIGGQVRMEGKVFRRMYGMYE